MRAEVDPKRASFGAGSRSAHVDSQLQFTMFRRAFTPLRAAARSYATAATEASGPVIEGNGRAFVEGRQAVEHHAAGSAELWRKITYVHPSTKLWGQPEARVECWLAGGFRCQAVGCTRLLERRPDFSGAFEPGSPLFNSLERSRSNVACDEALFS